MLWSDLVSRVGASHLSPLDRNVQEKIIMKKNYYEIDMKSITIYVESAKQLTVSPDLLYYSHYIHNQFSS